MSALTPPPPYTPGTYYITPSTSSPKRRKRKYAKAYGYLLDPAVIYKQAIEDGTVIKGQYGGTFAAYLDRLARHCGIKDSNIITIRNPEPHMPPVYCIVAATNLSERSKIPRVDIISKAKEFLGTKEDPKWYYIVRT